MPAEFLSSFTKNESPSRFCHGGSVGTTSIMNTQGPTPIDITVILCTYNRCEGLAGALQSIAASQVASSVTWEVLVVDNNSTDKTR